MNTVLATDEPMGLVELFSDKYHIEASKLLATLKGTAFKQKEGEVSNSQMVMLLVVAHQYNLNPFCREIFAFPDKNGIVPIVSVDGWSRIINEHPQYDGMEFIYSEETKQHKGKDVHVWIECRIYRKDRQRPTVIREYFDEVVRNVSYATPWDTHPKRMHRHKTLIQCARVAFGFAGIFDEDEAQRIIEKDVTPYEEKPRIQMPQPKVKQHAETVIEPAAIGAPLSDGELNLIKTKMEQAVINELDLRAAFNKGLDDLTQADFEPVMAWIADPMGAVNA